MKEGCKLVVSWSGGKDSCLALHRALQTGAEPIALLTMMQENGHQSRSHGLPLTVLQAQAKALEIPLVARATSWDDYEETFIASLTELKEAGAHGAVFGDIDIDEHREWELMVCREANLTPYLPLWATPRPRLLEEFWSAGFEAVLVAANHEKLGESYLGRQLSRATVSDFEQAGVDLCGEEGEYHTVVRDGPIFSQPLNFEYGPHRLRSGYWFVELTLI